MTVFKTFNQAGDTIVEVMASIAVLGLALGAAYGLSNRSFNTGVHTRDRIEALALAEGQVEFLRDKGLSGNMGNFIASYTGPFCFRDDSGATASSTNDYCVTYGPGNASIYNVAVLYCGTTGSCGQANVFTVRVNWVAGGSGDSKQLTLFYKPPS